MDIPRVAVRSSVLAVGGLLVVLVIASVGEGPGTRTDLVTARDGSPFLVPSGPGVHEAVWLGNPVLVFIQPAARLAAVEELRGEGQATEAILVGDGLALFVLSARSTHLGCTVDFHEGLGASRDVADYDGDGAVDGRLLDPCHHGQWDIYHRGQPVPGTATGGRMAALQVAIDGDHLVGSGFDGPFRLDD